MGIIFLLLAYLGIGALIVVILGYRGWFKENDSEYDDSLEPAVVLFFWIVAAPLVIAKSLAMIGRLFAKIGENIHTKRIKSKQPHHNNNKHYANF